MPRPHINTVCTWS